MQLQRCVHDVEEAVRAANSIGYPLVVKAVGDEFAHKTELGLVKLNITDESSLCNAVDQVMQHAPQILVEKMIDQGGVELIVGINRDPVLGLYLVIGAGGIYAELLNDTAIILLPFEQHHVEQALASLKLHALFEGYRNQPVIDTSALVQTIMNVQKFAISNNDQLMEMDINPLIVCRTGEVYTADALIRIKQP